MWFHAGGGLCDFDYIQVFANVQAVKMLLDAVRMLHGR
jgi:hypothetical protein